MKNHTNISLTKVTKGRLDDIHGAKNLSYNQLVAGLLDYFEEKEDGLYMLAKRIRGKA